MKTNFQKWQLGVVAMLALCWSMASFAEPYFTNKEGNLVWDKATNLVWQRCSVGQTWNGATCKGEAQTFDFEQAQRRAPNGWRVPTLRELAGLVHCSSGQTLLTNDPRDGGAAIPDQCVGSYATPTVNTFAFPATRDKYWSSTVHALSSDNAWVVIFKNGSLGGGAYLSSEYPVRLVRASQLAVDKAASAFPVRVAADSRQVQQQEAPACRDKYVGQRVYIGRAMFNLEVYGEVLGVGKTHMTVRVLHPGGSRDVKE